MRSKRHAGLFFASLPVLCSLTLAGDSSGSSSDSKSLLDTVQLGEVWFGPKLSNEDLKDRVVLIDFWGIN